MLVASLASFSFLLLSLSLFLSVPRTVAGLGHLVCFSLYHAHSQVSPISLPCFVSLSMALCGEVPRCGTVGNGTLPCVSGFRVSCGSALGCMRVLGGSVLACATVDAA